MQPLQRLISHRAYRKKSAHDTNSRTDIVVPDAIIKQEHQTDRQEEHKVHERDKVLRQFADRPLCASKGFWIIRAREKFDIGFCCKKPERSLERINRRWLLEIKMGLKGMS